MILLSSHGLCSPIISQKAKLFISPQKINVLIVPFAAFNNDIAANYEIKNGLLPFGFSVENIQILDITNVQQICDTHFDLIYTLGGDPFKLLKEANAPEIIAFLKKLIKQGINYFGISSGADFISNNIEYLKLVEDCNYNLSSFAGLGLIDDKILCHADQRDFATIKRIKECDDRSLILLRNDELFVIKNTGERLSV